MFKLVELYLGNFAVVKENVNMSDMPVVIHGLIRVDENSNNEFFTNFPNGVSKELLESNELDNLRREAIELTEEAIADEFGD